MQLNRHRVVGVGHPVCACMHRCAQPPVFTCAALQRKALCVFTPIAVTGRSAAQPWHLCIRTVLKARVSAQLRSI